MKRRTEFLRACTDQLDELGIDYTVEQGRHLKIRWSCNGRVRTYVMSITPSDVRILKHIKTDVRRMLRQDLHG